MVDSWIIKYVYLCFISVHPFLNIYGKIFNFIQKLSTLEQETILNSADKSNQYCMARYQKFSLEYDMQGKNAHLWSILLSFPENLNRPSCSNHFWSHLTVPFSEHTRLLQKCLIFTEATNKLGDCFLALSLIKGECSQLKCSSWSH